MNKNRKNSGINFLIASVLIAGFTQSGAGADDYSNLRSAILSGASEYTMQTDEDFINSASVNNDIIINGGRNTLKGTTLSQAGGVFGGISIRKDGITVEINNIVFDGFKNSASYPAGSATQGAVIYAAAKNINLNFNGNISFLNNTSDYINTSGDIYAKGGALNAYFTDAENAGTITFGSRERGDLRFYRNSVSESGGAVYQYNGTIDMKGNDIIFEENAVTRNTSLSATGGSRVYGGAISVETKTTDENAKASFSIEGNNIVFKKNTAGGSSGSGKGGAVYVNDTNSSFTVTGTTNKFESNEAGYQGGAIYNAGNITITGTSEEEDEFGTVFESNHAASSGAIYNTNSISINGTSSFKNNSSGGSGGAIYNNGSSANVEFTGDTSFTGNTATGYGGAFFNSGNAVIELNGDNNVFSGNKGQAGGAITNYGTITVANNATFSENQATSGDGGAIKNGWSASSTIKGDTTIGSAEFTSNSATGYGGAIANYAGSKLNITDQSTFTSNSAKNGGAVSLNGSAAILEGISSFSQNSATNNGGAVYAEKNSSVNITNALFDFNNATNFGGAVYADGSIVNITDSRFTLNGAFGNASGGAVYAKNSDVTIDGAGENRNTFSTNMTKGNGGAVYADGSSVNLTDMSFYSNNAYNQGGAVYATNGSTININARTKDVEFDGNAQGPSFDPNAVYATEDSTVNINASENHYVSFNDGVIAKGGLNINTNPDTDKGTVIFCNEVKDTDITINSGTLRFATLSRDTGEEVIEFSHGTMDANRNLTINNATLDTVDNVIRELTSSSLTMNDSKLGIDVNIDDDTADTFTGELNLNGTKIGFSRINVLGTLKEGRTTGELTVFKNAGENGNIFNNFNVWYNDGEIEFSDAGNGKLAYAYGESKEGFMGAVGDSKDREYVFSGDETLTDDIGNMAGEATEENPEVNFTILGDGNTLDGGENGGIIVSDDQILTVDDLTVKNFKRSDENGSFVQNNGGEVNITDGTQITENSANEGGAVYNAENGTINISSSTINANTSTGSGGAVYNSGIITIDTSRLSDNISSAMGGALYNKDGGEINIIDSIIENNRSEGKGGAIFNAKGGVVNISGTTVFSGNKSGSESNAIHNEGTVNLSGEGEIIFNDAITGGYENQNTRATDNYVNGVMNIKNKKTTFNAPVSGNDITVDNNATIQLNSYFDNTVNYTHKSGSVSLQNKSINTANLGNLTLEGDMNLSIDANFKNKTIDQITADSFNSNNHNINISDIIIFEPTKETSFSLSPVGEMSSEELRKNLASSIAYTGSEFVYSPLYKYSAAYNPETAMLDFNFLGNPFNPSYEDVEPGIMSSSVAAQTGGYLTQLASYDEAFKTLDTFMFMPKARRQALKDMNKYASADTQSIYTPAENLYSEKAGWFRPYAAFENIKLKNGPKVSNVAYGTYAGLESPLIRKENGWETLGGVYIGYNGSHQTYDGVRMYQNGGSFGLTGIAIKNNFFTGLTANAGSNIGNADSMFGKDDFTMILGGIASKTGYNIETAEGKFIIQPSWLMSYSFVDTLDYTTDSGLKLKSDLLNAIQLEPGLRFIFNLENGWQPYAGFSVVWNIMDKTQFKANDVTLPELSIKPFVKYGLGVRKDYGERTTGFAQAFATGGGRNGVGLQAGFRIKV